MGILYRFGVELFWTIVWVFIALIVGFFLLSWISNRNIPLLSTFASWAESHAQQQ